MNLIINGKEHAFDEPMNITQLIEEIDVKRSLFVVELNQKIINKDDYDKTILKDHDKVEIVSFVGGG